MCLKFGARIGSNDAMLLISILSLTTIFKMGRRCQHRTKEEAASAHRESVRKYSKSPHGQRARAAARAPQHRHKVSMRPTTPLAPSELRATRCPASPAHCPRRLSNIPQPTPAMTALNACLLPDEEFLFCEALRSADALDLSGTHMWKKEPPFDSDNDPTNPNSLSYRAFTYNLGLVLHGVRLREQNERDVERRAEFQKDRKEAMRNVEAEAMSLLQTWERVSTLTPYDPESHSREHAMFGHYKQWLARSIYHLYYLKFLDF
ncbi:hypothetical protein MSAN_00974100 [Mycena sanguinolenta]|uniref:Uncharacterized protein n=1 Tax=Mycena sanguinolenta TaxID=230812 RepID=A0A8H6YYM5_9AGAR|nr:hypothetical protein MSAN_00974100 [Mycena sanguinolenta]